MVSRVASAGNPYGGLTIAIGSIVLWNLTAAGSCAEAIS